MLYQSTHFEPIGGVSFKFLTLKLCLFFVSHHQGQKSRRPTKFIYKRTLSVDPARQVYHQARPIIPAKGGFLISQDTGNNLAIFVTILKTIGKRSFNVDVRRCPLTYFQRAKEFRRSNHLIHYSGPRKGLPASNALLGQWISWQIRPAIVLAYENSWIPVPVKWKAHLTRALVMSWAKKAGPYRNNYTDHRSHDPILRSDS